MRNHTEHSSDAHQQNSARRYRDVWASPGSQLHTALEDGDAKKAAQIYDDCERRLAIEQSKAYYVNAAGKRVNF
jgi:hypothetical protein